MDRIDQRLKDQDQKLDQYFGLMDKCWTGQDPDSVDMREDLRSDLQTERLPRQQGRPEGEDAYRKA